MNEPEELFEDSSDYTESPRPGPLDRSPRNTSGRGIGSDFQEVLKSAVSETEFRDGHLPSGLPVRRQGTSLHISYDNALEFIWGDDANNVRRHR